MEFIGDYKIFGAFIEKYLNSGFSNIDPKDNLVLKIDQKLRSRKQFFYIGDLIKLKILFASSGTMDIFGIPPDELDPATFYINTHPDDLERHNLGRTMLFKTGQALFNSPDAPTVLSSNFRFKNANGEYADSLVQCLIFCSHHPYKTVYLLQITSDISGFRFSRHGYHYYIGKDLNYFRPPDIKLLKTGNVFTAREFQIIRRIAEGLDSQQIAEKLFLSIHTVNKHRQNILRKSGMISTHDLVIDLKEKGML